MKRGLFILLFMAVTVLCAFSQNAKRLTGVIREVSGEVELKRTETSAFIKAKAGDTVTADTIISTGFKSIAIIEVGSSSITVRPLTRLSFTEIQSISDTETLNVKLQTGRVRVDVKPPAGTKANCTVQGPSATASVRGTSFEFDTFNLMVNEGRVAFRGNKGLSILIPAGMSGSIDADGKVIDPLGVDNIPEARKSLGRASTASRDFDLTFTW
jgi:hypothetical protein